jgi:2-keto-4-pentenoate hydratase/2-oxohepta-3-ene-1,7-dioic acid hydratase in catechol pathway
MALWARIEDQGRVEFGQVEGDRLRVFSGDMFAGAEPTNRTVALDPERLLTPAQPSKMIALWNNFHALAAKLGHAAPEHPLYFLKAANSFIGTHRAIRRPRFYDGKVVYEGELGTVIGRVSKEVEEAEAANCIFGYTCVNDVTAVDIFNADASFAQWTRAKSFDGFGAFGPVIATGLVPERLVVRTVLNGQERQNYPVADMIHPPRRIVSLISRDMTLLPGDIICCGTSLGVGTMRERQNVIEVGIEGIGVLRNVYEQ